MKLCFSFKDSYHSIARSNSIKVARNTRARQQSGNKDNLLSWNLQEVMTTSEVKNLKQEDQMNIVPDPSYVELDQEPEGSK